MTQINTIKVFCVIKTNIILNVIFNIIKTKEYYIIHTPNAISVNIINISFFKYNNIPQKKSGSYKNDNF